MSSDNADAQQNRTEAWSPEKDKILERLAMNEGTSTPWSELRLIIRQKLAQAVEKLVQHSEAPRQESISVTRTIDEQRSDAPASDGESARKRSRSEGPSTEATETPATEDTSLDTAIQTKEPEPQEPTTTMEEDTNQDTFTKPSPPQTNGSDTLGSQAKDIRDLEERIGYCLRTFDEAPFTIQRIAELLLWPEKHYKSVLKFLRAVERVVYVTSTVEEFPLTTSIRKDDDDAAIEDGGGTGAPDSLYSFIASTSLANNGMTNGIQTMTKAVAPKAVTSRAVAPRSVMPRVSTAEEAKTPAATVAPAATGNVPMDASDTGILHITPTSNDDADALKTKIQDSVDPDVPVYIDDHDGGSSKLTVQPVFPSAAADPKAESPEAMVEDDS